jgi:hypothetical protein
MAGARGEEEDEGADADVEETVGGAGGPAMQRQGVKVGALRTVRRGRDARDEAREVGSAESRRRHRSVTW